MSVLSRVLKGRTNREVLCADLTSLVHIRDKCQVVDLDLQPLYPHAILYLWHSRNLLSFVIIAFYTPVICSFLSLLFGFFTRANKRPCCWTVIALLGWVVTIVLLLRIVNDKLHSNGLVNSTKTISYHCA